MTHPQPPPMLTASLVELHNRHRAEYGGPANYADASDWARRFIRALRTMDIAEVLANAGLTIDQLDLLNDAYLSNDVVSALGRVGVDLPDGALHYYRSHGLLGWTNLVEGTVFEQAVADAANAGHITLPDGVDHVELAGRTQAGWDLALMDGDRVAGYAQVKFGPDDGTIVTHLQDHPDIPIVIGTHEAAVQAARHGIDVIDSNISYQPLHSEVSSQLYDHLSAAHFAHEWIPEVAIAFIVGTAAYRRWWRGEPADAVSIWAKRELAQAGVANAAATGVSIITGTALVRLPVSLSTRMLIRRRGAVHRSNEHSTALHGELRRLAALPSFSGGRRP